MCRKGKGIFVEVKSNILELPKYKSPLQENKSMYINQGQPVNQEQSVNQEQGMIVPNIMAQNTNNKKMAIKKEKIDKNNNKIPKIKEEYISDEFKQFEIPQKKKRYNIQEIENSADFLAIDG